MRCILLSALITIQFCLIGCKGSGQYKPVVSITHSALDSGTANAFSGYRQYKGAYMYGNNMGYYGYQLSDKNVAELIHNAGDRTIRVSLPDRLISGYDNVNVKQAEFNYYTDSLGMKEITAFLGEPNQPKLYGTQGTDNRDTITFPGCSERAKTFIGLYEPVWLDSAKTQINTHNTYAWYIYKTVKAYGKYIKFWEITNEPDFTYGSTGWQKPDVSWSWWHVNPNPNELENLKAPVFYYIHSLRVAWDVIKTLQPDSYVCTGGIGYPSFLDALLRNTDNPNDGSITDKYPLKAGAYFDILCFHNYPFYYLNNWDNASSSMKFTRHSDGAADAFFRYKNEFATVLANYGYDGNAFPLKQWICTETDIARETIGNDWGNEEAANNFIIKVNVLSQVNNIGQLYKYSLGEASPANNDIYNKMGIYGDLTPTTTTVANAPKHSQFNAVKTLTQLLLNKPYDPVKTKQLNLPPTVKGAAFKDSAGKYTYVLWAVTNIDLSEKASAVYTFPFSFMGNREEWNFSATNTSSPASKTVKLTGAPSFFIEK
ncbi:hypothetical protein [Ferruginibacter albus]|uniref:hypothetical protein n=1 Tax=Ferruginibacter albus TaxID=2875540 RepID=UPI001CC5B7BE|nr:hypothetical protein [Ferruginibacter albus]UAY53269.1 hypothetical protein K9M53_06250 [Ferruginibacter albus]